MPELCKRRCGLYPESPLDSPARHCIHDPDPEGWGPFCTGDHGGFCRQRVIREGAAYAV
jgi:hypothetical protein